MFWTAACRLHVLSNEWMTEPCRRRAGPPKRAARRPKWQLPKLRQHGGRPRRPLRPMQAPTRLVGSAEHTHRRHRPEDRGSGCGVLAASSRTKQQILESRLIWGLPASQGRMAGHQHHHAQQGDSRGRGGQRQPAGAHLKCHLAAQLRARGSRGVLLWSRPWLVAAAGFVSR